MTRLLLVDDNPSIHRIAESLLAHTEVELVCLDSGAEALARLAAGERFDAALVDTCMPGMDGWTLLERLRSMEASAHLPVALMAGVLDTVDPAQLAQAPAQGFLKKPIELRDLADRVRVLMAAPVDGGPSAPAAETGDDLLVLTEADLLPEGDTPRDPSLDLEELDLSVLDGLTGTLPPLEADLAPPIPEEPTAEPEPTEPPPVPAEEPAAPEEAVEAAAEEALPAVIPEAAAEDVVAALLADPGLQAALGRAVLARLEDATLREIAREALADLAGRAQGPFRETP